MCKTSPFALVIGGGPAGLMAAQSLLEAGHKVILTEAKPSLGRKLLMAGKSGLNLTKMEDWARFVAAYDAPELTPILREFGPEHVCAWARSLGQEVFTGSSRRVFPKAMKASPLLRAWTRHLGGLGLDLRLRWRWSGWDEGAFYFETQDGQQSLSPAVTVIACGGASWSRLGSDGVWAGYLAARGVPLTPFAPANSALSLEWSSHMVPHFGAALKNARFIADSVSVRGEVVISRRGIEGGGIYPLTPLLRQGHILHIDLMPDLSLEALIARLARPRGRLSVGNFLRKSLALNPAQRALIMELVRPLPDDPQELARCLKSLPVPQARLRPIDEAISTAGGVPFAALDEGLMLRKAPGIFCAGEMLDWEAPTGGYLLTACLATGLWAGNSAARWFGKIY